MLVAWKEMVVAGTDAGRMMFSERGRKAVDGASVHTCNYNGSWIGRRVQEEESKEEGVS